MKNAFDKDKVVVSITGYKDVTGGENDLKKTIAELGPVSVAIDALILPSNFIHPVFIMNPNVLLLCWIMLFLLLVMEQLLMELTIGLLKIVGEKIGE